MSTGVVKLENIPEIDLRYSFNVVPLKIIFAVTEACLFRCLYSCIARLLKNKRGYFIIFVVVFEIFCSLLGIAINLFYIALGEFPVITKLLLYLPAFSQWLSFVPVPTYIKTQLPNEDSKLNFEYYLALRDEFFGNGTLFLYIFIFIFVILFVCLYNLLVKELISFTFVRKVVWALGLVHLACILVLLYFPLTLRHKYINLLLPKSYLFSTSVTFERFQNGMSHNKIKSLLRRYLPSGRKWLDNRKSGKFYSVHAGPEAYCAYNNDDIECKNMAPKEPTDSNKSYNNTGDLPNVIILAIESFTMYQDAMNDDFLMEHVNRNTNGALYYSNLSYGKQSIFPHLTQEFENTIAFSGTSSFGYPTCSGFHGLLTGLYPSQSRLNVKTTGLKSYNDYGAMFRSLGYKTLLSKMLYYDGFRAHAFRKSSSDESKIRMGCKSSYNVFDDDPLQVKINSLKSNYKFGQCNSKKVNILTKLLERHNLDQPASFDYFVDYLVPEQHSDLYGISSNNFSTSHSQYSRIRSATVIAHYKQLKRVYGANTPVMMTSLTYDTHFLFFEPDTQPHSIEVNYSDSSSKYISQHIRALKYTDRYYIKNLIDFIKNNDNNTIFIVTGDHGLRFPPLISKNENIKMSRNTIFGHDSMYVVPTFLLYFGDNPKLKELLKFDQLRSKTFKFAIDHNDVIYSLINIIANLSYTEIPPSTYQSRNIFELASNALLDDGKNNYFNDYLYKDNWFSLSYSQIYIESTLGNITFKANVHNHANMLVFKNVSYPLLILGKNDTEEANPLVNVSVGKKYSMLKDYFNVLNAENYILYQNMKYHKAFLERSCVEKGNCVWPSIRKGESTMSYYNMLFISILIGFIIHVANALLSLFGKDSGSLTSST